MGYAVSVDFGSGGKSTAEKASGILAESRRLARSDNHDWTNHNYHHWEWADRNQHYLNPMWNGDYNKAIDNLRTKGTEKAIRKDAIVLRSFFRLMRLSSILGAFLGDFEGLDLIHE